MLHYLISKESRIRVPFTTLAVIALGMSLPAAARAHFLWLSSERPGVSSPVVVHAFLSETPTPEGPEFLKHIANARITRGQKPLTWKKGEDTYQITLPASSADVVDGTCDLGVMTRRGETFRLFYTARVQFRPSDSGLPEEADELRLRWTIGPDGVRSVKATFRGKPASGASITLFPEEADSVKITADGQGRVHHPILEHGRVGLLAKWSEKAGGELAGKSYTEIRYNATLTLVPSATVETATEPASKAAAPYATLPEAVNSFGGAVAGDWLYVYSGHVGKTHVYHDKAISGHFRRLNLKDRTTWEELPMGLALQGVTLLAHKGLLYRVGGMAARNKQGLPNDLASVSSFARFDPDTKTWSELASLPEPRSTHDAVVLEDALYVIGGWSMNGGGSDNAEFLEHALIYDLSSKDGRWEKLPTPPFRRRALAVAAVKGKVYVLGGLTEEGEVVKSVDVYDPETRTWAQGPELPGGKRTGFAPSAFGVEDRLYVSGVDGSVLKLSTDCKRWETVATLSVPRLTHRLLPGIDHNLLAVGGTSSNAPTPIIESIAVSAP